MYLYETRQYLESFAETLAVARLVTEYSPVNLALERRVLHTRLGFLRAVIH